MTKTTVTQAMRGEMRARMNQAQKAGDLLRSAADRLDTPDPDETEMERAARLRGSSMLALTAGMELAACSGWLDAFVALEMHEPPMDGSNDDD
jgi:hypothetical protein